MGEPHVPVAVPAVTRKLFGEPERHVGPDVAVVKSVPVQSVALYALTVYVQPLPVKEQLHAVQRRLSS